MANGSCERKSAANGSLLLLLFLLPLPVSDGIFNGLWRGGLTWSSCRAHFGEWEFPACGLSRLDNGGGSVEEVGLSEKAGADAHAPVAVGLGVSFCSSGIRDR